MHDFMYIYAYVHVHLFACEKNFSFTLYLEIDECTTGNHNCKSNEHCVNKPGGFICECASGFKSVDNACEGIMYINGSYICS